MTEQHTTETLSKAREAHGSHPERILLIAAYIGKYGETDGVVTTYENLIPRFAASGLTVDVVAYGPKDQIETFGENGNVTVYTHNPHWKLKIDPSRWIDLGVWWSSLDKRIRQHRYTLVQSSSPDPLGLWAAQIAEKMNCPLLSLYHTALDQYVEIRYSKDLGRPIGRVLGKTMRSWINSYYNRADLVLAPSEFVKDELQHRITPPIEIFSRGVDTVKFNPKHRTRPPDAKPRAIYVGRVVLEKSLDVLVELFKDRDDVELMIVGDGNYLKPMQKLLPQAKFTGRLHGEEISRAYADADLFVFPSETDTLGQVVMEGMASGLPAVVTDKMGPKELVNEGVTGFVTSNPEQFREAANRLMADRALRQKMSVAARAEAETRTWDGIFEVLRGYHQKVTELHRQRRHK